MRHRFFTQAVWRYLESGLSIIPINARTKRPYSRLLPQACDSDGNLLYYKKESDGKLSVTTEVTDIKKGTWKPYQDNPPSNDDVSHWLSSGVEAIAVIGGEVSGGVEILDFDIDGYYDRWAELVAAESNDLPVQRTGGGGFQVAWRSNTPEASQKIAWHPDNGSFSGRRIAVETRGLNGYALLPPSVHPSGNYYELLSGRFSRIPTIDQKHRNFLLTCARSLCQAPKTRQESENNQTPQRRDERSEYTGDSVIDAFNEQHTVESMLKQYGYTDCGHGRYSRPDKADSAGVVIFENGKSYHMSTNDPLDSDAKGLHQPRSPFDFYTTFEHNGSYRDAVREAAHMLKMQERKYPQIFRAHS